RPATDEDQREAHGRAAPRRTLDRDGGALDLDVGPPEPIDPALDRSLDRWVVRQACERDVDLRAHGAQAMHALRQPAPVGSLSELRMSRGGSSGLSASHGGTSWRASTAPSASYSVMSPAGRPRTWVRVLEALPYKSGHDVLAAESTGRR